jgi:hypothetical protein
MFKGQYNTDLFASTLGDAHRALIVASILVVADHYPWQVAHARLIQVTVVTWRGGARAYICLRVVTICLPLRSRFADFTTFSLPRGQTSFIYYCKSSDTETETEPENLPWIHRARARCMSLIPSQRTVPDPSLHNEFVPLPARSPLIRGTMRVRTFA